MRTKIPSRRVSARMRIFERASRGLREGFERGLSQDRDTPPATYLYVSRIDFWLTWGMKQRAGGGVGEGLFLAPSLFSESSHCVRIYFLDAPT
jgi:hypothetical protein